ncbi:MAG TPA: ABC transporter permease [Flavilitoribacter sp.]|nr:ABC transporter permease [Lewinella sp.]MCB9279814.1 ABC transporter permease [Lewinellaceae bacterium]HMQ62198.1 ABC transporter permease [Flavilitoribacter sp.]HMQ89685.1 ABC transporter permease [Flavilitoribacter sp.]
MRVILRIIRESISQALQQLRGNKLRSFLSLLGVSIGIFCIIGVLSAVDSLEDNVRGSLEKLGNDIVYVKKWPWADVGNDWWKFLKRPNPSHDDYLALREKSRLSQLVSFHVVVGFKTLKFGSSSVDGALLFASSMEFPEMFKLEFDKGRYFSPSEYNYGSNKIVLGYKVAEELFRDIEPIGREVKLQGKNYEVIGIIEKAGKDLINPLDFDEAILVSYPNGRSLANLKARQIFDATITVKAGDNVKLENMKDEVRGILRAKHRLKPRESEDFSLNELSMISKIFDSFFAVLNILGIIIGAFAMLVGVVSVANIMFVSVKERTGIIGIKKALGAKQYVILLEFLIEAVILCLLGGAIGLFLIFVTTKILTAAVGFDFYIDLGNVTLGVMASVAVGVIAGIIPALRAARMDPVEAMRK